MRGDDPAGIDALQPRALARIARLEEVPPGDAVLGGQHEALGPERAGDVGGDRPDLMRLHAENDEILRPHFGDLVGREDTRGDAVALLLKDKAIGANGGQMRPARDHADLFPGMGKFGGQQAANRPRADHADLHALPPHSHRLLGHVILRVTRARKCAKR